MVKIQTSMGIVEVAVIKNLLFGIDKKEEVGSHSCNLVLPALTNQVSELQVKS